MGIIDDFLAITAGRRRQADLTLPQGTRRLPETTTGLDEFGAPEGGFGRLDLFAGESLASDARTASRARA